MVLEAVRRETTPHDLGLRLTMWAGRVAIERSKTGLPPTIQSHHDLVQAARLLEPRHEQSSAQAFARAQLVDTARSAFGIPDQASDLNVEFMLGTAAATLEQLACNKKPDIASLVELTSDLVWALTGFTAPE